jgi:hypothetical protein
VVGAVVEDQGARQRHSSDLAVTARDLQSNGFGQGVHIASFCHVIQGSAAHDPATVR